MQRMGLIKKNTIKRIRVRLKLGKFEKNEYIYGKRLKKSEYYIIASFF
jgi:hypothetical protein